MGLTLGIQVIHVTDTRIIAQGADRVSRGMITEGVMLVEYIFSFVPIKLKYL